MICAVENPGSDNLKSSMVIPSPAVRDRVLKDLFHEGTFYLHLYWVQSNDIDIYVMTIASAKAAKFFYILCSFSLKLGVDVESRKYFQALMLPVWFIH